MQLHFTSIVPFSSSLLIVTMKAVLLSCFVFVLTATIVSSSPLVKEWETWKGLYKKTYSTRKEELQRLNIWETNRQYIEKHNANSSKTYTLKVNEFTDMTPQEFTSIYNGFRMEMVKERGNNSKLYSPKKGIQVPSAWDWRQEGYVTGVKNQGDCGSCWSFATTGALEGQHYKATGQLISLSEQQLVDCTSNYGEHGCKGGNPDLAFRYIAAYGIESEAVYPYTAEEGTCMYSSSQVVATCRGYVDVAQGYESLLLSACYENGPISVAIDASHPDIQHYGGGVYSNSLCSSTKLDHGVLVVGFGSYNGQDYWLIKNSWGTSWGLGGYFLLARNMNNMCGVATMASYPTV